MGSYPHIARGGQKRQMVLSQEFNIDNGAGTTVDELIFNTKLGAKIKALYYVVTEGTDSSMGAPTIKVGTTPGGVDIVAATTILESQAVGAEVDLTLVTENLAAGSALWVRHTGIAATQAGKYRIVAEIENSAS